MNYQHIANAIEFYKKRGYTYMDDAPWVVGKDAYYATKPPEAADNELSTGGYAVASGEQSFLQKLIDDQPIKRAVCVTPCFRHYDKRDAWHHPWFMKVELINAHDTDAAHLIQMIHDACSFFEQYVSVSLRPIGSAFDIVEKHTKVELGSYGIRERDIAGKRYRWIYGTGCAEPRLSSVLERLA